VRVLLVDDDAFSRKLMAHYLTPLGVSTSLAGSGFECLEFVAQEAPDLILMDCQMPGMDGFETVTRLRATGFAGVILALTASCDRDSLARCRQVGMNGHLSKPIAPANLRDVVAQIQSGSTPPSFVQTSEEKPEEEDPLARARFLAKSTGNPAVLERLVSAFVKSTEELVQQLQAAIESNDPAGAAALTHRLKGGAGTFGATALSQAAGQADTQLREQGMAASAPQLQAILVMWKQLKQRIESAGS
jgi:CheY-like chemotaxis protein